MSLSMQEILPDGGLASFQNEVSKLADLGRYEDAYIVHAAEGETIVPMAVFDENPRLKAMLFAQMRGMGIDPQRYIVGNELNSINPVTGQPEFFLKKIFKQAKKAVKKLAPYAGTIAGIAGLGPMGSAIVGAGVPLLMGEDMSAAIAGGLGGYGAGSAFGTAEWARRAGKTGYDDYALAKLFGDQGGIGPAFDQVKKNLGFGKTAGSQKLDAETISQLGLEDNATWADIAKDESLRKRHDWLVKKGVIKNPASAANWAPWLKAGSAFSPAILEGMKPDDSPMGMPHGWDNIYPSNPWYGNWAAPGTIDAMAAGNADGGIIQKFENGGKVDIDIKEIESLMQYNEMTYEEAKEYLENLKRKEMNTGGIVQLAEGTGPRGVHPGTSLDEIIENVHRADRSLFLRGGEKKLNVPYDEMMNKQMMNFLIEEFERGPTDFERKYGNKVTETIRGIMGLRTKEDLTRDQGAVFDDNSSEIVGYNIANGGIINTYDNGGPVDMPYDPEGTREEITEMYPAFPYLSEKYENTRNKRKDFNPLDYKEAYLMLMQNMKPDTDREIHEQEFLNWFNIDPNSEEFEDRKNRLLRLLSNMPQGGFGYESIEEHRAEDGFEVFQNQNAIPGPVGSGIGFGMERANQELAFAEGGIAHLSAGAFPRMTGAIAGPGGPKDDMVPAMLSDGEFVMTAEAVRNAGGGDRREGARRMYQLMNQLQGAA